MGTLKRIALILLIIGGLNWGLIGLFQFDLVAAIFGGQDAGLSRVVYSLVGISALYCVSLLFDRDEVNTPIHARRPSYGTEFGEEYESKRDE